MNIRSAVLGMGLAVAASAASACPNFNLYGATYELHGSDLYSPQTWRVQAGGDRSITGCGIRFGSDRGRGFVTQAPDFSIRLSGMERYSISFSVRSRCDSILLINTGSANWFYDDDDNGNYDAKITLSRPSNGWMDIWVGTHDGTVCDAELTLETFYR